MIVSSVMLDDHPDLVREFLKKMDADNLRINLYQRAILQAMKNWLGYNFTKDSIKTLETKKSASLNLKPSTTLNKLRSFLGSVHHRRKFRTILAELCHILGPLLKNQKNTHGPKVTIYKLKKSNTEQQKQVKNKTTTRTENQNKMRNI